MGSAELTELQVWIKSPDSECDTYPSVTSDESHESLRFAIFLIFEEDRNSASTQIKSGLLNLNTSTSNYFTSQVLYFNLYPT